MRRWTRRSTRVVVATLFLATAGQPSANAACPVLDLTCQAEDTVGVIEDVVNDDPIDTPGDGAFDPIVDDVLDRADGIVGGGPVDLPALPDPIGGGGGNHGGPAGGGPRVTPGPAGQGGRGFVFGKHPDGSELTRLPKTVISATSGVAPSGSDDRTAGNRFDGALGDVARGFAILLALFGLAVGFVALQDRLDRHDPRLALAPVESDVVEFA